MTLAKRVIPVLSIIDGELVKTKKFKNPTYIGDPLNAIKIFNEKEVDEIIVLDIRASKINGEPNYRLIADLAGECFIPLTYGGGIKSIDEAKRLFSLGIEKICLQSSVLLNPDFIRELVGYFGSQSIVISVDIKRDWLRRPKIFRAKDAKNLPENWWQVINQCVDAGAGEIFLNSVEKDGTLSGPDLEIIRKIGMSFKIPIIACGGISSLSDMTAAFEAGADAVAAGAFFVFHGPHRAVLITYPSYSDLKAICSENQFT